MSIKSLYKIIKKSRYHRSIEIPKDVSSYILALSIRGDSNMLVSSVNPPDDTAKGIYKHDVIHGRNYSEIDVLNTVVQLRSDIKSEISALERLIQGHIGAGRSARLGYKNAKRTIEEKSDKAETYDSERPMFDPISRERLKIEKRGLR